jgi:hypothetical protein
MHRAGPYLGCFSRSALAGMLFSCWHVVSHRLPTQGQTDKQTYSKQSNGHQKPQLNAVLIVELSESIH